MENLLYFLKGIRWLWKPKDQKVIFREKDEIAFLKNWQKIRDNYECWRRGSERKILRGWHKDAADCFRIYSEGLSGNLHLSLLRKLSYFPRPQFPSLFRQKHFPCQEAISFFLIIIENSFVTRTFYYTATKKSKGLKELGGESSSNEVDNLRKSSSV